MDELDNWNVKWRGRKNRSRRNSCTGNPTFLESRTSPGLPFARTSPRTSHPTLMNKVALIEAGLMKKVFIKVKL